VITEDGRIEIAAQFKSPCSGLGFLPDGTLLASLMQERVLARVSRSGEISVHADLSPFQPDHINDIVTDAQGRTYVDCLSYQMDWRGQETLPDGTVIHLFKNKAAETPLTVTDRIVLVEANGSARVVATDLLGPNGLAITGDGKHLIVAEWRINRLTRFRIEPDGSLSNRELFANTEGLPDGICCDAEDAVWVACPTLGDCTRVLMGGKVVERIKVPPGNRVTACVLGGPERRTLYLTTDRVPAGDRVSGCIEVAEVAVPGVGYP
jgi:sugar lactone lactonase YvrE